VIRRVNASYSWGCKGVGEVGGDIFLREVQTTSAELQSFAATAALEPAGKLEPDYSVTIRFGTTILAVIH
jgi:hypothetical protein